MIELHGGPRDGKSTSAVAKLIVSVLPGGERHVYERVKLSDGRFAYGWVGLEGSLGLSPGGAGRS